MSTLVRGARWGIAGLLLVLLVAVPVWADNDDIMRRRLDASWVLVEPPLAHEGRYTGVDTSAPLGRWREVDEDFTSLTKEECLAARLEEEQDRGRALAQALEQAQGRKQRMMRGLLDFLYGRIDTSRDHLDSIRAAQCVTFAEWVAARRAARTAGGAQ